MSQQLPWLLFLIMIPFLLVLSCAEEETPPPCAGDTCGGFADIASPDVVDDTVSDIQTPDTEEDTWAPDVNVEEDTDTGVNEEDVSVEDIAVDLEGPFIEETNPAHEEALVEIPFVVNIVFNEPIRTETVDSTTFVLSNHLGQTVDADPVLSDDQTEVSLTPEPNSLHFASPYTVTVSAFVQDLNGNAMNEDHVFEFYTTGPDNLDTYAELAANYAPVAWQETRQSNTHVDYPTAVNFDGNWVAEDNPDHIAASSSVSPAVYWDVSETQSHLFLTYLYFYPMRDPAADGEYHVNDTAGVMLVYEKGDSLTPIEAITYSHNADLEDLRGYAVDTGSLASAPLVDHVASEDILFPEGRFSLYLGAPQHQACAWGINGSDACELNEGITKFMTHVQYRYDQGVPTLLEKTDGDWPTVLAAVDFELISGLNQLWARRNLLDDGQLYTSHFTYNPQEGQPGNELGLLPSFFDWLDDTESGRPYWAWAWNPSTFTPFTDLPRGTFFLDPAYFLYKRHSLEGDEPWSPDTPSGWSLKYCFHPAQGIDQRGVLEGCELD